LAFAKHWQVKAGDTVSVKQSHGGSGKRAGSVIDESPRGGSASYWWWTAVRGLNPLLQYWRKIVG
jgi:hypothetical protein